MTSLDPPLPKNHSPQSLDQNSLVMTSLGNDGYRGLPGHSSDDVIITGAGRSLFHSSVLEPIEGGMYFKERERERESHLP